MNGLEVRPARDSDFDALVPLMKGFATTREIGLEQRFARVLQNPDMACFVATLKDKLLGYALAQGYGARLRSGEESVRLHDLMVVLEAKKSGVGTALFLEVQTWVKVRGARYLEWQSSSQGVGFYERLGFKSEPPQPDYPFFEIDFGASPKTVPILI